VSEARQKRLLREDELQLLAPERNKLTPPE